MISNLCCYKNGLLHVFFQINRKIVLISILESTFQPELQTGVVLSQIYTFRVHCVKIKWFIYLNEIKCIGCQ